jgi:inosose dehydratase
MREAMKIRLANAPTSWGIEKPSDPSYPPWQQVLDEIALAGYEGTELGPYGFMPTDPRRLADELAARNLIPVAGTVMQPFHSAAATKEIMELARVTASLLQSVGARYLVLIAGWSPERVATAGRAKAAPRLDDEAFSAFASTLGELGALAADHGLVATVHPHAGTYLEFADEIERCEETVRAAGLKYCIDTGHVRYAGMDPLRLLKDLGPDVAYVHLKDLDLSILERARAEGLGFWEAYSAGIFCVPGTGVNDFGRLRGLLDRLGYEGWATVEQDAAAGGGRVALEGARAALAHLASTGWQVQQCKSPVEIRR